MRKIVIIFWGLLACVSLHAQEVRDVTFKSVGNTIEICYRLQHLPPRQYAWIEIYYSLDDGKNWQGPLKRIAGDVGRVEYGGKKRVVWDVFSELEKINGILAFEVRASVEEKRGAWREYPVVQFIGNRSFGAYVCPGLSLGMVCAFKNGCTFLQGLRLRV